MPRNLAVVAGNGLSIACSPGLALGQLTTALLEKFDALSVDGSDTMTAVQDIAQRVERDNEPDSKDFEKLVGAFDTQTALLRELKRISSGITQDTDGLLESIDKVISFTESVRDVGIGFVLQEIFERTQAADVDTAPLLGFLNAMKDSFDGQITLGNLNFDGLIMSTMLEQRFPMCDMASGIGQQRFSVGHRDEFGIPTGQICYYMSRPLRTNIAELPVGPQYRIRLVHPHGALNFTRHDETGAVYKIPTEVLRRHGVLSPLRYPKRSVRPAVVLTNAAEKPRHVQEEPFKLAYEVLAEGFRKSDHWLIAGYSFRDKSVNDMIGQALWERHSPPKILVSTHGSELTREFIDNALRLDWLPYYSDNLVTINRDGIGNLATTWDWGIFRVDR